MALIAGAMIASAVVATAWKFGRADGQPREMATPAVLAAPSAAVTVVRRPYHGAVVTKGPQRGAATKGPVRAEPDVKQGTAAARSVQPSRVPAKEPEPTRSPQPEAKPYGPWQCRQTIAFDFASRLPLAPKPCQMLGRDIQYQASLTAPGGGTGSITVALQDANSGRTVAGPKTCGNLTFGGDAATQGCGPAGAKPARGRKYTVVMSFRYVREGRTISSTSRGSSFAW